MASAMDEALDALLTETDKTYAKFSESKSKRTPDTSAKKSSAHKVSRSRLMEDTAASASFKGTALNDKKSILETATQDRKMAYVMKRMEQLERDVKRLQADKDEKEALRQRCDKLEADMKAFKTSESKVHGVTNDMITTMKQQLTILLRKDELIAQADHRFPPGESQAHVDADAVAAKVYEIVQKDVSKRMDEVLDVCMKEQTSFLNKWADGRVQGVEDRVGGLEEAVDTLVETSGDATAQMHRMRQELVEDMTAENSAMIDLIGLKVNEALSKRSSGGSGSGSSRVAASQALNDSRFESIREEFFRGLEAQADESSDALTRLAHEVRAAGDAHAELEMRVARVGAQAEEALAGMHAVRMESAGRLGGSMSGAGGLETCSSGAVAESPSGSRNRETDFLVRQEAMKFEAAIKGLQRHLVSVQSDVEGAHITIGRQEERLRSIGTVVDEIRLDSRVKLTNLTESDSKLRLKVVELERSHQDVLNTRGAVEAVLREIDARSHDDASWAYQFKQAAKALDRRVSVLETDRGLPVGNTNSSPMRGSPLRPGTSERLRAIEARIDNLEVYHKSLTELNDKVTAAGPALSELCEASLARLQEEAEGRGRISNIEDRLEFVWRHGGFAEMHHNLLEMEGGSEKPPEDQLRDNVVVGPSTLNFHDDEVAASRAKFHISNATEQVVAYKTFVSVQHVFTLRPVDGYLRPGEVRSVDVVMRPGNQRSASTDLSRARFAVELVFPTEEDVASQTPAKELWSGAREPGTAVHRKAVLCNITGGPEPEPELKGRDSASEEEDSLDAESSPDTASLTRRVNEVEEVRASHRNFFVSNFVQNQVQ